MITAESRLLEAPYPHLSALPGCPSTGAWVPRIHLWAQQVPTLERQGRCRKKSGSSASWLCELAQCSLSMLDHLSRGHRCLPGFPPGSGRVAKMECARYQCNLQTRVSKEYFSFL